MSPPGPARRARDCRGARRRGGAGAPGRTWWPGRTSRRWACPARAARRSRPGRGGSPDARARRGAPCAPPARSMPRNTGSSGSSALAPGHDHEIGPLAHHALDVARHRARVAARVAQRQERASRTSRPSPAAPPRSARAAWARGSRATPRRWCGAEAAHGDQAARAPALPSTCFTVSLGDGQGRDLGLGHHLARVDGLKVPEREDGDAGLGVGLGERRVAHAHEAAPRGRERPLPAGIAADLHAVAGRGLGDARARGLLVDVAGLELEDVDLLPRRGQGQRRRRGVERLRPCAPRSCRPRRGRRGRAMRPASAPAASPSWRSASAFT